MISRSASAPPPTTAERALVPLILSVSKSTRQLVDFSVRQLDITIGQDQLILTVEAERWMTVGEIAKALRIRSSTTSRMVDILMAKGWLVRKPGPSDLRRSLVRLTPSGAQAKARVVIALADLETSLQRELGADAGENMEALGRLSTVLADRLAERRSAAAAVTP